MFYNFSPILHSLMMIWPFQEQFHFRLYLQKFKLQKKEFNVNLNLRINLIPFRPILETIGTTLYLNLHLGFCILQVVKNNIVAGIEDIQLNFILTIFHCDVLPTTCHFLFALM